MLVPPVSKYRPPPTTPKPSHIADVGAGTGGSTTNPYVLDEYAPKSPQTPPEVIEAYRKEHGEHHSGDYDGYDSCSHNFPAFAHFSPAPHPTEAELGRDHSS
jgi:hypothetical protein